jgi:predicted choloylglycine hydrolase
MKIYFQSIAEPYPGDKWQQLFERYWPSYLRWFMKEGDEARPTYLACERALRQYMPELLALSGQGDQAARFLSLYRPTNYMSGCSQAVWTREQPFLIRNYDYSSQLWEGKLWHTAWNGTRVIAMSDCLWGVLDGMNEKGLAVSLAFGGRKTIGDGFGIPLILRYILEFCATTAEATSVLRRVPSHMAYNVTVLDKQGAFATVFVSPDQDVVVARRALATNHQDRVDWPEHARATASLDRAHVLSLRLQDAHETRERFAERFLEPPLYQLNHDQGWGTLYTARYDPTANAVSIKWPGHSVDFDFDRFVEQYLVIRVKADKF